MDVLNSFHTPIDTRRPRRATLMASALAHGGFLLVLAIAAYTQMLVIHPHELRALTFVTIAPLPVPPPAVPPKPLRLPPIVKEEVKPVEAPRVAIAPPPVPEVRPNPAVRVPLRRDESTRRQSRSSSSRKTFFARRPTPGCCGLLKNFLLV